MAELVPDEPYFQTIRAADSNPPSSNPPSSNPPSSNPPSSAHEPQGGFVVRFRGDLNTVRAETFIAAVTGQAAALHGIASYVNPEAKIEVRISAPRKGSFEFTILLQAVELGVATVAMFGPQGIEAVSKVISLFSNSLSLLKHLKGKPPTQIQDTGEGSIAITNIEGNVTIIQADVLHIYQRKPEVPEALGSTFRALENEPAIDGIDVVVREGEEGVLAETPPLFTADRVDFGELARSADVVRPDRKIETVSARIYPVKFVTEVGYKWSAYYDGNKISVSIEDDDFIKDLLTRRFGYGDFMDVTLEIHKELDTQVDIYVNKAYVVSKVHAYHERPPGQQGTLFKGVLPAISSFELADPDEEGVGSEDEEEGSEDDGVGEDAAK